MTGVSIIIPLYNKAGFVGRALKSVFSQSFQDYEVIVVDDGSTDSGAEIVRSCKDKRVRLIQQANAGPGAARNRGIRASRYNYVTFLDADDEWLHGFLQTSIDNLRASPDCVVSVTGHCIGEEKCPWPGLAKLQIARGPWRLEPHMDPRLMGAALAFMHSAGALMCRREVLMRFGGFYEKACVYGEDLYLWLQVMLNCRIFRDPAPLFWQHTESSELTNAGRAVQRKQPVMPFLTFPDVIRRTCPQTHRKLLERYLAYEALCSAHECSTEGNVSVARGLLMNYPWMKSHRWQYTKLRYKLAFPKTVPFLRKSKRALRLDRVASIFAS
ncbi:MAG: glycosyltransferase family 2 protein [Phycisphaerae bacterium]|nr:glycosyltransferase family 2 protein [Phycisphaerae bacterium]